MDTTRVKQPLIKYYWYVMNGLNIPLPGCNLCEIIRNCSRAEALVGLSIFVDHC